MIRYIVEYETDGENSERRDALDTLEQAKLLAAFVTSNGVAWPCEAIVYVEVRDSRFHDWRGIETPAIQFIDGEQQGQG